MGKEELVTQILDKLDKLDHIPNLFLKGGLALAGYQATGHWTGALTALIGLRLAEGANLAGGAAGVAALTLIGLTNAFAALKASEGLPASKSEAVFQLNTPS